MKPKLQHLEPWFDENFEAWKAEQEFRSFTPEEEEALGERIRVFLANTKEQPIQEYMLERKYNQLHDIYEPKVQTNLFGQRNWVVEKSLVTERHVKSEIWVPESPDDYLDLEPELLLTNKNTKWNGVFNALRLFTSTGENNNNIGRNLYYVVRDRKTEKYLGTLNLSSDYLDVACRDKAIGWTREQRNSGQINYTSVGSIIVPTQPLGYNYVGGKLLSLLLVTDQVQEDWRDLYGDPLVGLSTTSFYGSYSQYTGLKYWKKLGKSMGSSIARPNPQLYAEIREWLKWKETRKYWEWYHATDPNGVKVKRDHINRSLNYTYRQFGFSGKDYITGHQRGIYFCPLYTNTNEFLRGEIAEDQLVRRFDNSIGTMTELWKSKYAGKRIRNLVERGETIDEVLFYDDMLFNDWPTIKDKYLPQVGR